MILIMKGNTCRECNTDNVLMIEYGYMSKEHYDGISEIRCKDCGLRWGRWTDEIIPEGYEESRFGARGVVKIQPQEDNKVNSTND